MWDVGHNLTHAILLAPVAPGLVLITAAVLLRANFSALWEPPSEGEEFGGLRFDLNLDDGARVCRMRIDPDPMPNYPEDVLERYGVGAVVVRIVTDSEGAIIDIQPVATVGGAAFEQSVRAVANRWRLVPGASYSEPCTREAVMFLPITFRVGR